MIRLTSIPPSTATEQSFLVECEESVCQPFSVNNAVQPIGTISFQTGSVTTLNGTAIVPLIATVVVATPSSSGCGCCHNQIFVEKVNVPFTATTANTITLDAGASSSTTPIGIKCCKASGIKLTSTVSLTIA